MTEFKRRVRDNYELLRDETWVSVCADKSLEEVQEELYSLVIRELDRDKGALGQLWVRDKAEQMEAEVVSTPSSSHPLRPLVSLAVDSIEHPDINQLVTSCKVSTRLGSIRSSPRDGFNFF